MPSFALLKRKEMLVPTWRGWVIVLLLGAVISITGLVGTVPFLAVSRPENRGILVVEGWLPDYALEEAKATFESHPYRVLVLTGVPIEIGFHISQEKNYAQLAATTLKHLGVSPASILTLPCAEVPRDRTFATAARVKSWLESQPGDQTIDVLTLGVHARRTWLLYRKALGSQRQVGIISAKDDRYDRDRWWTTSSGFRTVTSEAIAYLYAKLLFFPHQNRSEHSSAGVTN